MIDIETVKQVVRDFHPEGRTLLDEQVSASAEKVINEVAGISDKNEKAFQLVNAIKREVALWC